MTCKGICESNLCEICEIKSTKKWNYPCRDECGMLAELEIVCNACHDEFSLCNCPRKKTDFGNSRKGLYI